MKLKDTKFNDGMASKFLADFALFQLSALIIALEENGRSGLKFAKDKAGRITITFTKGGKKCK